MKKYILFATLLAATPMISHASDSFELNISNTNIDLGHGEEAHKILGLGYRKHLNKHFSASAFIGRSVEDTEIRTFTDTYLAGIGTEDERITETNYISKESVDFQYGLNVMFDYPLANAVSIYAQLGYVDSRWSSEHYPDDLVDNKPSSTPHEDLEDGLNDCEITGRESACGNLIESVSDSGSFDNFYWGTGLVLYASERARVRAGYSRSINGDVSFDSFSVGFSMVF